MQVRKTRRWTQKLLGSDRIFAVRRWPPNRSMAIATSLLHREFQTFHNARKFMKPAASSSSPMRTYIGAWARCCTLPQPTHSDGNNSSILQQPCVGGPWTASSALTVSGMNPRIPLFSLQRIIPMESDHPGNLNPMSRTPTTEHNYESCSIDTANSTYPAKALQVLGLVRKYSEANENRSSRRSALHQSKVKKPSSNRTKQIPRRSQNKPTQEEGIRINTKIETPLPKFNSSGKSLPDIHKHSP